MSKYSWHEANGEAERLRQEQEKRERDAEWEERKVAAIVAGRQLRAEISQQIVGPFLEAMRKAGNPGLDRRLKGWSVGTPQGARHHIYCDSPTPYCDVYLEGSWVFGFTRGMIGRERDITEGREYSSNKELPNPEEDGVQLFHRLLARLLTQHGVPLPRD